METQTKPVSGMIKLTDQEFVTLSTFVRDQFGINLSNKRVLIEGRMSNVLRERGMSSFQQYLDVLFADRSGAEVNALLNRLTTNHSYFMREKEHFNFMSTHVLPFLEKNRPDRDLRIWSAGCSAGQEAYTMAIVIDEYFGSKKSLWDTTILATDISMNVLEQAKRAIYTADNLRDIPPHWLQKYFVHLGGDQYQVCDRIRSQVVFRHYNLMEPIPFQKPFDLIFCRNVMIYFDAQTKKAVINRFYDSTSVGGFLFIGHSEVISRDTSRYTYIKPAIYQRKG